MTSPLTLLSSYYLDCLSKEVEEGLWRYASNNNGNLDYGQLFTLPYFAGINNTFNSDDSKNIINKVRQESNRFVLQLGYPINIRKPIGKAFLVVEPILLFQFDTQSFIHGKIPELLNESPVFNFEAVKNLSGLPDSELLNEVISLSDELGLNEPFAIQESFETILIRLQQIRPHWNWKENIIPSDLTKKLLNKEKQEGIYNAAALFSTETSKFTKGLEKELNDLNRLVPDRFSNNALHNWIAGKFPSPVDEKPTLIEPLSLNKEQREAVKRALNAPLTVIKGPPGTGKSQVVTSIIVNAIYQGQTVLFTSRNNKAVDVVYERINGLASSPVMLRLGSKLQANLITALSNILAATVSPTDHNDYNYSKSLHESLTKKAAAIDVDQNKLINARNSIDKIEQTIEPYREIFGDDLFQKLRNWHPTNFKEIEQHLNGFGKALNKADKSKQGLFSKLFWFILQDYRFKNANSHYNLLKPYISSLALDHPQQPLASDAIELYLNLINQLRSNLKYANEIHEYFRLLNILQNHKSLFQLTGKIKELEDRISENSIDLWQSWLKLLPDRLENNRHDLSEYVTLLNLIADANATNNRPPNGIWGRFYSLQEKITNILSCWSVTSLSVKGQVPFKPAIFDLVIIDEASQCDIASALPLLYRAKRAVIIGDDKQLTHITAINKIQDLQLLSKHGLDKEFIKWSYSGNSLFGLAMALCSPQDIVELNDHHRSHADIINFSNKEFYNNRLRVATKYASLKSLKNEPTVRWINVPGRVETPNIGGSLNSIEANEVLKEVRRLVLNDYKGTIGVVTPFKAQAIRIRDLVSRDVTLSGHLIACDFLASTVQSFQGDERDVIIFSPVISDGVKKGSLHFLSKTGNLFNVAITRARAALIIVGDEKFCSTSSISYMEKFVDYVASVNLNIKNTKAIETDFGKSYPIVSSNVMISSWEKKLYEGLYKKGIRTNPQYQVEQYTLDFALFTKNKKLNIEVDGEKYHRDWDGELVKRDQLRNKRLIELGWDVLRFWVYEVRDDFDGCVLRVQKWVDENE